jgi:hypothetical protein
MAIGPAFAGRLQDAFALPSAALVAAALSLVTAVPLSLVFVALSKPKRATAHAREQGVAAVQ